jgi:hypothetical protein
MLRSPVMALKKRATLKVASRIWWKSRTGVGSQQS